MKNASKTLILIPALNEEKTLPLVLKKLKDTLVKNKMTQYTDILVVNDNSSDNTEHICKKHEIKVITNFKHLGYGSALQVGYRYAINKNYDYVIQMDADGQHDETNIKKLYDCISENSHDIIIGNRFTNGYKTGFLKKMAVRYFTSIIKIVSNTTLHDPTSGLQAINKKAIYYFSKYNQYDNKFPDSNILLECAKAGFKIKEIPVKMHDRKDGKSMFFGFRPLYYMLYMSISIISVILRKDIKIRYSEAVKFANND